MSWVLRDTTSGEFFTLPHGEPAREWSLDIGIAHQFCTLERAEGGATVWWHVHKRALEVVKYPNCDENNENCLV